MYQRKIIITAAIGAVLLFLSMSAFPTAAQISNAPRDSVSMVQEGSIDPVDLENFLDGFFSQQMEGLHIPGAAVVFVKDGEILLSKGYGYADIEAGIPVDPARTIMRAGSVSKLVTATAAMQQVERGQLSLYDDVNQYLKTLQVPFGSPEPVTAHQEPVTAYQEPVTVHQLLTHTAGFEDLPVGSLTLDANTYLPLQEYLAGVMPERVLEPGTIHAYSNYSFSLVGQLVEDTSGMPFSAYVAEEIFQPLGMDRSTFEQPLPPRLSDDLAVGYLLTEGGLEPAGFLYDKESPASGLSTTAVDMAHFMIAHLQDGRYDDARVLEPVTAQLMHRQQFTHHKALPGLGYAFKERYVNGNRLIGHGGDIGTYSSQMILHPEDGWGLYVQYNVFNDALRERLIAAFMDRYYPAVTPESMPETLPMKEEDLARFVGSYRWVRHSQSTIGKLLALMPGPVNVIISANQDSTLSVGFFGADAEWRYAPVGPLTFKQVQGGVQQIDTLEFDLGDSLVFREGESGAVEFAFVPLQIVALQKVAWYEGGEAQMGALGIFLIVFLSPFIVWPLGALVSKVRGRSSTAVKGSRRARILAAIVSGLNFIFMLVLLFGVGDLSLGVPWMIKAALVIPVGSALLSVVLFGAAIWTWIKSAGLFWGRAYVTLIALAALLFVPYTMYWNIFGWQF